MGTEPSEDFWALIMVGNRSFLGEVIHHPLSNTEEAADHLMSQPCVKVLTPFEVTTTLMPMRGPDGRPAINKEISAEPVLLSFEGSPAYLKPTGLMFFREMQPGDRERYKKLIEQAKRLALGARASASGIAVPPQQ